MIMSEINMTLVFWGYWWRVCTSFSFCSFTGWLRYIRVSVSKYHVETKIAINLFREFQ
jgi:hypothetical protein